MTDELAIRGGTVVDAHWAGRADVIIADGKVQAIAEPGSVRLSGADEVDAANKLVLPGGVDPHCHVGFTSGSFTSKDDYWSCTAAAVLGGTTTIVDFAIPEQSETPIDASYRQRAKITQGICDAAIHGCVVDWDPSVPDQLATMVDDGIRTVKMFTTYRDETMADERTILRVMSSLNKLGGMVVVHCEADHLIEAAQELQSESGQTGAAHMSGSRPELAETASVATVLAIAESIHAPVYFVHQSTARAVEMVAEARLRGLAAFSEAVAHHLTLGSELYDGNHPERYICCPPLRPRAQVSALGRHLFSGAIATIGSDHCCYDLAQKASGRRDVREAPNGLPGVETRLIVTFSEYVVTRGLPITRFVELTAANPARLNGLYPQKGTLLPGADADVAIWDPQIEWEVSVDTLHMATDYTPYEGMRITGRPDTVLVGGKVVADGGQLMVADPRGKFVAASRLNLDTNRYERPGRHIEV